MTLYELTDDYKYVMSLAEDPEVDPQTISDTLESIGGEIEDKADSYAKVMKNLDAEAQAIKAEIDRLTARKTALENNSKRIKESLQNAMQTVNKPKFKTTLFSFGIQKNPPSLDILPTAKVPKMYLIKQDPKVDKKAIIADLKAGKKIKGMSLVQTESLRIR